MKRAYSAGHFELQIDGQRSTAYLKSVEGGMLKGHVIDEPHGNDHVRMKHLGLVEVEPFTIDAGIAGAGEILKWIQSSWRKEFSRRNGQITHANFNLYGTYEHEFFDALVQETVFPTLDGASKEAAYLKVKIQPERVVTRKVNTSRVFSPVSGKQKQWLPSAFRLHIDGMEDLKFVNKIESFTIKQGIKKFNTGEGRYAQIEPTKLEFPNLTCTIALDYAGSLLEWHDKYVSQGFTDPKAQRSGSLEFLTPNRKDINFRLALFGVSIPNLQVVSSTANSDQIKRVKFELSVERMDLDGMDGFQ